MGRAATKDERLAERRGSGVMSSASRADDHQVSSMTGVGVGRAELPSGARLSVELRSINHRYLEVRVRAPEPLSELAPHVEEVIRRRLVRGRITAQLTLEGQAPIVRFDLGRAEAAFRALVELRDRVAPHEPVPLTLLASVPGVFEPTSDGLTLEALHAAVGAATEAACRDVEGMRAREGAALRADVEMRFSMLLRLVDDVEERLPLILDEARVRMRTRLARLLGDAHSLSLARVEQEIVLLADRSDVSEELTRLRAHIAEGYRLFDVPIEGRGKRLDFLCQELAREANTLGQKSADVAVAKHVIALKTEIERIREQIQNLL